MGANCDTQVSQGQLATLARLAAGSSLPPVTTAADSPISTASDGVPASAVASNLLTMTDFRCACLRSAVAHCVNPKF